MDRMRSAHAHKGTAVPPRQHYPAGWRERASVGAKMLASVRRTVMGSLETRRMQWGVSAVALQLYLWRASAVAVRPESSNWFTRFMVRMFY